MYTIIQCDFHFKIMSYELKFQCSYKVTRDETWNVLRNRNDSVSLHVCLVNVQWSSDWISRFKLQSIHVLSLSVVMRGPGAACRWHDHEGLEEDCLERPEFFFLFYSVYICHDIIIISLPVSLCLFFSGWKVFFLHPDWHYFLTGLRSDLWGAVAPVQARQTLAQVLCETLEVLVQRYSRARPSYKRLSQIRYQIWR